MSPRTPKENQRIREESRRKIIGAALELFSIKGYHSTSISSVAKKAQVSQGLMYNYFESKEALLQEIVAELFVENEKIVAKINAMEQPLAQIRKYLQITLLLIEKQPKIMRMLFSLALQPEAVKIIKVTAEAMTKEIIHFFAGLLEKLDVKNPLIETYIIIATMDGLGLHYLYFEKDRSYPWKKIKTKFIEDTLKNLNHEMD